jgi:hypothetical protein
VKLKTFLITASLWMGLLGLTACGDADVRTYQYPETAVLFDDLHIKKTIYRKFAAQAPCFDGVSGALAGLVEEIPII